MIRILYHIAKADFLERVRRHSYLVALLATLFLGYQVMIGNVGMYLGDYRGVFNSAWVGVMMAMTSTLFVTLIGFYVVKNCIERDRATGVGQILAATPLTRLLYLLGKWLSNFAVLATIVMLLGGVRLVVQLWRGDEAHIDLGALLLPFLFLSLPAMAVVAALAVLFETMPCLRGGFGNVAWFFLWAVLLVIPIESNEPWADMSGIAAVQGTLLEEAHRRFPEYRGASPSAAWPGDGTRPRPSSGRAFAGRRPSWCPAPDFSGSPPLWWRSGRFSFDPDFDPAGRLSWRPGRKKQAAAAPETIAAGGGMEELRPSLNCHRSSHCCRRISGKPPRGNASPPPR